MTNKKQALLGHLMVILGCYSLTWGIYLAPISEPTFIGIILKPLFWGLILILSGICVIVHSYCACIRSGKCSMKK